MRDDPPVGVEERLAALRLLYVAESDAEARARLAMDRPKSSEPFEIAVGRRLRELRALVALATHLHRGRG